MNKIYKPLARLYMLYDSNYMILRKQKPMETFWKSQNYENCKSLMEDEKILKVTSHKGNTN